MNRSLRSLVISTRDELRVFVRQARSSARQALFFLGLLYRTDNDPRTAAVRRYAPHALAQVRHLLRRVMVPLLTRELLDLARRELAEGGADPEASEALEEVHRGMKIAKETWAMAAETLLVASLVDEEAGEEPVDPFEIARDARYHLGRFLRATEPKESGWGLFQYIVVNGLRAVHKNLSLLLGVGLVFLILFKVEAVHSLWRGEGWWSLLIVLAVAGPLLVTQGWRIRVHARCRRRGCDEPGNAETEVVPRWDVGGRPFRSLRPLALEPSSTIRRWPGSNGASSASGAGGAGRALREIGSDWLLGTILRGRTETILSVITSGQIWRIGVYLVGWLVVVGLSVLLLPDTMATVFIIFSLCYWILVLAHLIDLWEFLDPAPARLLTLVAVGLLVALQLMGTPFWLFVLFFLVAAVGYLLWFLRDPGRPFRLVLSALMVVLAFWTALVWDTDRDTRWPEESVTARFEERIGEGDWPAGDEGPVVVMAASGGGSRSAVYTGMTLTCLWRHHPEIASQLQAISSVSGGSLANAAYLARALELDGGAQSGEDGSAFRSGMAEKLGVSSDADPCAPLAAGGEDSASGLLEAPLVQALSGDFLRPTLRGFLLPWLGRGEAIEATWREGASEPNSVGLGDWTLDEVAERWRSDAERPPFPVPIFNTTTLEGHNLVISPFESDLLRRADQRRDALGENRYLEARRRADDDSDCWRADDDADLHRTDDDSDCLSNDDRPTRVSYRDAVYSLEDVLLDYAPNLASAVRASANFPFGFPLVDLEPQSARFRYLEPTRAFEGSLPFYWATLSWVAELLRGGERVQLTDGGALSNSGFWSLHQLLLPDPPRSSADCAMEPPGEGRRESLRCELMRRGVLVIVVEASKMPVLPSVRRSELTLAGTLKDQSPIGQYLHRTMFDLLELAYPGRLAIVQIDLVPLESRNVLTTWALSQSSLRNLRASFQAQWPGFETELAEAWEALNSGRPPFAPTSARPPLD